jgi:hypothetical protein
MMFVKQASKLVDWPGSHCAGTVTRLLEVSRQKACRFRWVICSAWQVFEGAVDKDLGFFQIGSAGTAGECPLAFPRAFAITCVQGQALSLCICPGLLGISRRSQCGKSQRVFICKLCSPFPLARFLP